MTAAEWDSRGPLLSVQGRDQRTVVVLAADAVTGQTTLLHTELAPGTPARTSAGDLVTVSDRDCSRRLVVGGAAVTPDGLHIDWVSGTDGEAAGGTVVVLSRTEGRWLCLSGLAPGEDRRSDEDRNDHEGRCPPGRDRGCVG